MAYVISDDAFPAAPAKRIALFPQSLKATASMSSTRIPASIAAPAPAPAR